MISINENISNMLNKPARRIRARVELYECSTLQNDSYNRTLLNTFYSFGDLQDFKLERIAEEGKFFGFGVSQKLTVKLRDRERAINIVKGQVLEISFGVDDDYTYPCPLFRVEEVSRNETNNDLTITSYDFLYKAGEHRVSELGLTNYTIRTFVYAIADLLNLPVKFATDDSAFDLSFPTGANFDGSETLRVALNAVADATQTIFFVDWDWRLTFKRLDQDATPVMTIDKSKYFELKNKSDRTLTTICHATELGDNIEATTGQEGVTQYVRNNPFWDLREDVDTLLNNALAAIAGITISQFDCSWRGNFALEIGDKINIITKDDGVLVGYVLNDTITYNGGLKENTFWNYTEHTAETAANPVNLGEALKQTYARVDKANKTITLLASETNTTFEEVRQEIEDGDQASKDYTDDRETAIIKVVEEKEASIKITTDSITERVSATETRLDATDGSILSINESISEINQTADSIASRVSNTETRLDANDKNITNINADISSLEQTATSIESRVSSTESRLDTNDGEIDVINEEITVMKQTATSISAEVSRVEQVANENFESVNDDIATLTSKVEASITAEDVTLAIKTELDNGVDKVTTTTGFTFNDEGLTVSKSGSEMTTQITEDGMTVYRDGNEVLTADNTGVKAENLHATTYLIIGKNSRFEDYEDNRTGCFWIGG